MNSIERVFAAVAGVTPDRPPVSLTASLYGAALLNCPVTEYYRNAQLYAEGQLLVAQKCNTDVIFSPFVLPLFAEACGASVHFKNNAAPNVKEYVPYVPGSYTEIDTAKLLSHPVSEYILRTVDLLAKNTGKEKVIAAILFSPCDLPAMVFGIEKWLHTLLFFQEEAMQIIHDLGRYFIEISRQIYACGAHLIVTTANFTNPQIVTPYISTYVIPLITEIIAQVEGAKVIHHGGHDFGDSIKNYLHLNGVAGFVISPRDNIKEIRQFVNRHVILGNIDGPVIGKQSAETVYKKCHTIIKENEGNPRFILTTSNADIAYETPLENVLAISRAALDFAFTKTVIDG